MSEYREKIVRSTCDLCQSILFQTEIPYLCAMLLGVEVDTLKAWLARMGDKA